MPTRPFGAPATPGASPFAGGGGVGAFGRNAAAKANPNAAIGKGIISGAQGAGFFDPMGSPAIRKALQRRALRNSRNRQQHGQIMSRLAGVDPYSARQSALQTDNESAGQTADFLNESQAQEMFGNRDFARGVYGQERGYEEQRASEARQAQREKDARGNPLLAGLGQIAGGAAGAFIPGAGRVFGGMGGGGGVRPPTQYDPNRPWMGSY